MQLIPIQTYSLLKKIPLLKVHLIGIICLCLFQKISAQSDYITIQKITVSGNKKTKERTILRELDFNIGDTIHLSNLSQRLAKNQALLMNTGLFTTAKINVKNWDAYSNQVTLRVQLKEFWFIYPFPILELSDRNFNEWWQTYDHSLKRVNIGLRFYHINLTGRNDLLKLVTQLGFTRKYEIDYTLPSINRNQTFGIFTNALYTQNKELAFGVRNDTLQYFRDPNTNLLQRIRVGLGLKFRPDLYTSFSVNLKYHHNLIDKKVPLELNPNFFSNGLKQRYFSLRLEINWDKRDIRPYPINGHQIIFSIQKDGFGLFKDFNAGHARLKVKKYIPLNKKWSTEFIGQGQFGIARGEQPYYNYKGLGYGSSFIRGYELYVINGLDYAFSKTRLRFEFVNFVFEWGKIMPIKAFRTMPVKWYLTLNNDFGIVNDPFFKEHNNLRNELLWGGGIGLDIVVFYDKVFQFEYAINRLGERGFFLHWALNF